MNSVLHLKGQFDYQPNRNKPGPKNLPVHSQVKVKHIKKLLDEMIEILNKWQNDTRIGGALISVHYRDVVAKSNRISSLLAYKSLKANDSIRGSRFDNSSGNPKHIFTHFVPLVAIEDAIRKLRACITIIMNSYHGVITHEDIEIINKTNTYKYAELISKTSFIQTIIDTYFVERFNVDTCDYESIQEKAIVTLYSTGMKTVDLLHKLGIVTISSEAEMLNETTLRMSPEKLQHLWDTAPYLIAMQVKDMAKIPELTVEDDDYGMLKIASPTNEPIIGVIDTPFYSEGTYFSEWVDYHHMIDSNISITREDCRHGTAVSSILVDGSTLNPQLADGCGNFRVRHFGVACGGRFSSFTILKKIREIVSQNADIKVWNLSLGSTMEIDENFISPEAAELDRIQSEYDVIFVVSGTNKPKEWNKETMKIGAPADSLNSLVVNAVDMDGEKVSYHRVGPVLSFFHKPDVSYYGGDGYQKIRVYVPGGEGFVVGTSFAAPFIARKMAYLIYNMHLSREVAKALIIDSAAGWNRKDDDTNAIGYGVVPININNIINCADDEIRFIMTGSTDEYETYTYKLPVPLYNDKHPYFARATLCYFPKASRDQGVDYTDTEMDIHFGRVKEEKDGKVNIKSINNNNQGVDKGITLYEGSARELYRKWDNIKHISEMPKKTCRPKMKYGVGNWGLSIKTKERLKTTRDKSLPFGVVVTLKEMNGVNRIDDFIKLCQVRGWIVNRVDVNARVDVYNKAEEEIIFD